MPALAEAGRPPCLRCPTAPRSLAFPVCVHTARSCWSAARPTPSGTSTSCTSGSSTGPRSRSRSLPGRSSSAWWQAHLSWGPGSAHPGVSAAAPPRWARPPTRPRPRRSAVRVVYGCDGSCQLPSTMGISAPDAWPVSCGTGVSGAALSGCTAERLVVHCTARPRVRLAGRSCRRAAKGVRRGSSVSTDGG